MNDKLKGNLAMSASKTFSGLNQNALKYLVPTWMSPLSGVTLRLCFGALAFWGVGVCKRSSVKATAAQRIVLLLIGAVLMFGYMFCLLAGLKYTTPVTSSIFLGLEPAVVFILCAVFMHDRVTLVKVVGIAVGLGGALICVFTQKASDVASNPLLGCLFCAMSTVSYSVYLIVSKIYIARLDSITVSKYTFLGGAISSVIAACIVGWDAPVLHHLWSPAMAVLAFVLIFPTTVSYFLLDIGLKYLKPTIVALYGNLILIVSATMSYILGQDIFSWWQIMAIALMAASVYLVEVAESKSQAVSGSGSNA